MGSEGQIRDYFTENEWTPTPGGRFLAAERFAILSRLGTSIAAPEDLEICDVGCGAAGDLVSWRDAGVSESRLHGTELVPSRAEAARAALPEADIHLVDGFNVPLASASVKFCTASLVLSSIRDGAARRRLLAEMARVTAPGGRVAVYDFRVRKPWNRNVVAISDRMLADAWRRPDVIIKAAPFLPILELALRLPRAVGRPLIALLPRTHRVWSWTVSPDNAEVAVER